MTKFGKADGLALKSPEKVLPEALLAVISETYILVRAVRPEPQLGNSPVKALPEISSSCNFVADPMLSGRRPSS